MLYLTTIFRSRPRLKFHSSLLIRMLIRKPLVQKTSRNSAHPSHSKTLLVWSKTHKRASNYFPRHLKRSARLILKKIKKNQTRKPIAHSPLWLIQTVQRLVVTQAWLCHLHLPRTSTQRKLLLNLPSNPISSSFTILRRQNNRLDTLCSLIMRWHLLKSSKSIIQWLRKSMVPRRVPHQYRQWGPVSLMWTRWRSWLYWDSRPRM